MKRVLRHVIIAFALVFAQQAAQLHSLSHLRQDLARAAGGKAALGHPAEQCIAFHAVDSALPCRALAFDPPRLAPAESPAVALPISRTPRLAFDPRAPPRDS